MAVRPVFSVSFDRRYCICEDTEFEFFSGFSMKQKQRCIKSLHQAFARKNADKKILEISGKSETELGVKLSAFHLTIKTSSGKEVSVESAFQAGKEFERGGPYQDLLYASPRDAKRDERLKNSGGIIAFHFDNQMFETEPKTYFYHWLYLNAVHMHTELAEQMLCYDAFTDIEFNPKKSINCQAQAAAVYVSLEKQGLLLEALKSKEAFLDIVYGVSDS